MGHADLRIRERTMPAVADRAYELLRNRAALSAFVQMRLETQHAAAADRAALDLEDAPQPARLVVTREGHAVTCLGPGMVTDAPVIPWPETRAYLDAQQHALRTRLARARAQEEDGESALSRVYTHPHRLTRAEFDTLVMLAPLLVDELHSLLQDVEDVRDILLRRLEWNLDDRVQHGAADAGFRMTRAAGLMLLATQQEPRSTQLALDATMLQDGHVARLGWWVLLAQPRRTLAWLQQRVEADADTDIFRLTCGVVLMGLGSRFPWLVESASGTAIRVMSTPERPVDRDAFRGMCRSSALQARMQVVRMVFFVVRARMKEDGIPVTLTMQQAADAGIPFCNGQSKDLPEAMDVLGPEYAAFAREWDPFRGAEAEPRWSPLPAARISAEDLDRADTWREVYARLPLPLVGKRFPVAVASSMALPEALVPDDRFRKTHTQRQLQESFVKVELAAQARERSPGGWTKQNRTPVTAAEKPGPNAPCTCGSGKKYKKCCGAA